MGRCKYCGRYRDPGDRCECGETHHVNHVKRSRAGGKRKPAPAREATPEELLARCIECWGEEAGREHWEKNYA